MTTSIYSEAAALQALIEANLRVLYPVHQMEVVTYKGDDGQVFACVVRVPSHRKWYMGEVEILHKGEPGDLPWGFKHSLESVFRETQELLGTQLQRLSLRG
ncbi:hypothetical protein FOXG_22345 [Fusarium oxysporum f. sp. lycopersici 4287]|uniref:Uncharacterized protein n=3 Tax=Fusarium oxysporum TaxID=5507 RepID=A0A0J9WV11_FUSO4|nr:hypothetical protein FOXG_22345 [Fusarium oxysporum f. sp. lycopersici 4287]EXK23753.1 hypothetical protein FOMG_19486 [Fusarium oxysporum f. sp. melonis 26406]KAJ9419113.1 hypothetical protein QL093DRAFT_2354310 [Fusarium oxysporum]KNB18722.1 hypothetical protein FOXG_22345 [Fusarium oxysporum f. sp. lycopersici 4287]